MKYNRPQATASWGTHGQGLGKRRRLRPPDDASVSSAPRRRSRPPGSAPCCASTSTMSAISPAPISANGRATSSIRYALCPGRGRRRSCGTRRRRPSALVVALDRRQCRRADHHHAGRDCRRSSASQNDFAKQIKQGAGPISVSTRSRSASISMELPMLRALEKEGIEVVDGQQAMLDAREIKTADEIELLKVACRHGRRHLRRHRQGDPAGHARKRTGRHRQ